MEKYRAKACYGEFRVQRKASSFLGTPNLSERTGLNLGLAGSEIRERTGPNPSLAGLEFGEKTGPNQTGPNPGLAGSESRERQVPFSELQTMAGSEFRDRTVQNLGSTFSEFGERTLLNPGLAGLHA